LPKVGGLGKVSVPLERAGECPVLCRSEASKTIVAAGESRCPKVGAQRK
jgi:hypothetical protein